MPLSTLLRERLRSGEEGPRREQMPASDTARRVEIDALKRRVRDALLSREETRLLLGKGTAETKPRLQELIAEEVRRENLSQNLKLSHLVLSVVVRELADDMLGYGPIQPLLEDPAVTEIMVVGPAHVWYQRDGVIHPSDVRFRDDRHVRDIADRIVAPLGRRVDESSPMVDARLPDGSRVNVVLGPICLAGTCITIRKFGYRLAVEDLLRLEALTEEAAAYLNSCVRARLNILVSGGTDSGKTTLLNCLGSFIPSGERIIVIEDSAELRLQHLHVVPLESRPPNVEGTGEITIRALVRNSLRMRPDRIVVGEVRGKEVFDLLQAMNTGHDGSMSTVHANSAPDALNRLVLLVLLAGVEVAADVIREQIVAALDLVVQVTKLSGGSRRVVQIAELAGLDPAGRFDLRVLFGYDSAAGRLQRTGAVPGFATRLREHGIDLP